MPANSVIPRGVLPTVRDKCADVIAGCPGKVRNVWGYNDEPDHNNRRCIDFMIYSKAFGDAVAAYLIDNADRLGLNWLIWNGRIYRHQNTNRGHGWGRYYGEPHRDHVHAEFDARAIKDANRVATGSGRRKVSILAGEKAGGWFWGTHYVNVDKINHTRAEANAGRWDFQRDVWYLQKWLIEAGYAQKDNVEATGYWNGKTQRAYNRFRRSAGYRGKAAQGTVGRQSLAKLQAAAAAASAKTITS